MQVQCFNGVIRDRVLQGLYWGYLSLQEGLRLGQNGRLTAKGADCYPHSPILWIAQNGGAGLGKLATLPGVFQLGPSRVLAGPRHVNGGQDIIGA